MAKTEYKMLTDKVFRAKLADKKPGTIIWDSVLTGYGMRIGRTRRALIVQHRIRSGGQFKTTIGHAQMTDKDTAGLSAPDARKRAGALIRMCQDGIDPREAERRERLEAVRERRTSFAGVAADWMTEEGCRRKDAREQQRKLDVEILPVIGHIPITELRRFDVKALVLDKAAEARVQARHLKGLIHRICNYAIDEELIEHNPATRITVPTNPPRERILTDAELARFWNSLQFLPIDPQLTRIFKLLLVCGQRRSETTHMKWSELDLAEGRWELPGARTKSGRPHFVPLTRLALGLIGEDDGHEYVFHRPDGSPIPVNTVSHAMWRHRKTLGFEANPVTVHDLRRSFASGLSKLGIERLVISKLLAHAEGGVTQIYDRWDYWERKQLAMESWAEQLQAIITGEPAPSKVTRLRVAQ